MSISDGWKATPMGRVARYVGSVRFAVPLLAVVAAAMVWGTWVDSTQGREAAARLVYGSVWFMGLMALVCASLVISVLTRYPWRRKHMGFMIVHASLIALIVIGFYTMYTKVEGRVVLEEGEATDRLLTDGRQVELLDHQEQGFLTVASAETEPSNQLRLGDLRFEVRARWGNSVRETEVLNDGEEPLHAVEIAFEPGATEGTWVGEAAPEDASPMIGDLAVRVVPQGQTWAPPAAGPEPMLTGLGEGPTPVPAPEVALGESGWTVTSVDFYKSATIGESGITDRPDGPPNPAVRVVLTHADGSTERHIAFERFRDSPFKQRTSGETDSPFALGYQGEAFAGATLAIMRDGDGRVHALYAAPGAEPATFANDGQWPWVIAFADRHATILRDFDRAQRHDTLREAPAADLPSPAVVVAPAGSDETTTLLWNQPTPVVVGDRTVFLRYGPVTQQLPFRIELVDFRESKYPGSQMAMAFESDVRVSLPERETFPFRIFMNNPYHHGGWKVYQSGFQGSTISVFQVTKDPGLVPMYIACTTLCIGILVTFYSRSLSWGHPEIPAPFQQKPE